MNTKKNQRKKVLQTRMESKHPAYLIKLIISTMKVITQAILIKMWMRMKAIEQWVLIQSNNLYFRFLQVQMCNVIFSTITRDHFITNYLKINKDKIKGAHLILYLICLDQMNL